MEFFETAHIPKRKKISKTDVIVKKQLKQMLQGYKQSDNELIRNSGNVSEDIAEAHRALDDSSSVSGFSDLDLTKSDDEEDANPIMSSDSCPDDISDSTSIICNRTRLKKTSEDSDSRDTAETTDNTEEDLFEQSEDRLESISECDEDSILDEEVISLQDNDEEGSVENLTDYTGSTSDSSPFISVTATEMSDQSLSQILGDYKHPTVKKSTFENKTLLENNTCFFSTDNSMQVEDIDDIDSLRPEIGDQSVIEDIELDTTVDSENVKRMDVDKTNSDEEDRDDTSTKHKAVQVYYGDTCCIVVLPHPANLYINGKVTITLLAGKVEIYGHILKGKQNVYSPNNSFAQCLKTVEADNNYYGLFSKLTKSGLPVSETEAIVTKLGKFDGVVSMTTLKDIKMDFVDNHFPADVFTRLKADSQALRLSKASDILGCNLYLNEPMRYFENYIAWDDDLSCAMKKSSRGIVCGGKDLGKSTLIRYYVNRVLSNGPVLVIDLDPGQAEFTVAGNISATIVSTPLLGPNFTHLKTPEISYNLGMINVMDNTFRYISTAAKLIEQCQAKYSSMPWIINTMGMTNHMGLKLIVFTIIHAQPTFLIQIDSKITKKRFEFSLEPQAIRMVYENCRYDRLFRGVEFPEYLDYKFVITTHLEGSYKQDTSLSRKEERYLNFLAYFGELLVLHNEENILGLVPYEIKLTDVNILTNVNVSKDAILKVINGKIVALCELESTDKGKVFTLQDNAPLCHGHGLIRCVDLENSLVYVLTPVASNVLSCVNALVYSDWVPELQRTERLLPPNVPVPYRAAAHQKQLLISPRRRFNPLQLLKMSRST